MEDRLFIASIYPMDCTAERPYSPKIDGGSSKFVLPKGSTKKPSVIAISNHVQKSYMGADAGYQWIQIRAEDIRNDLLRAWSTGLAGQDLGFGPGVFISEHYQPSEAEIAEAQLRQNEYFRYLIEQGDKAAAEGRPDKISHHHRLAAKEMGYEQAKWTAPLEQKRVKDCNHCFTSIDARATVCPNCKRDLVEAESELVGAGAGPSKPVQQKKS